MNKDDGTSEVVCSGSSQRANPEANGPGGGPAAPRPRVAVPDDVNILALGNEPTTGLCYRPGPSSVPRAAFEIPVFSIDREWNRLVRQLPRCPSVVLTPQEVAVSVVEAFPFPAPKPYIAPGKVITGLRAFLEPRSPTTVSDVRPTPLGDIQLNAAGEYYVNWGDAKTGPHPGPGGPWPNGNISHVYTHRGVFDVQVTVAWTVRWQMAGTSGTLNVSTDGALRGFPVEQLQAVRNR
ncbi:MAG: hypothetical protein M3N28_11310 [Actinomycetota bacterium]|nr:hypothetical protein [Actinomycetota bacterium]